MRKRGYYEYDPVIYPRKLWVHIGYDLKELAPKAFYNVVIGEKKIIVELNTEKS